MNELFVKLLRFKTLINTEWFVRLGLCTGRGACIGGRLIIGGLRYYVNNELSIKASGVIEVILRAKNYVNQDALKVIGKH